MRTPPFLMCLLMLAAIPGCQPLYVKPSIDKGFEPQARTYAKGEDIWVEVRVPMPSGVSEWAIRFEGEQPFGLNSHVEKIDTVFAWRIKAGGQKIESYAYRARLEGGDQSRELKVSFLPQSARASITVLAVLLRVLP